jgi:MMP 1-O-methyltransferase
MTPDHPIFPVLDIEGSTSEAELLTLFELAQEVRDGCIVEVGSWRGRSTGALAIGSRCYKRAPVYAIEPHEEFDDEAGGHFGCTDRVAFFQNMLRLEVLDIVRLVNLSSEIVAPAWPKSVGLLWIDGNHTYDAVRRDVLSWLPRLRPDAIVAFHDANEAKNRLGPYHVVEELMASGDWKRGREIDRMKVLHRRHWSPLR